MKLKRVFLRNFKTLAIVISISAIVSNYINFEEKCKNYYKLKNFSSFNKSINYYHNEPIIFIGGVPRSGTTLMRVLLDAHPLIRCGEETRILPRLFKLFKKNVTENLFKGFERNNGFNKSVFDSAMRSFILEIIIKHGKTAPFLCNKDPFILRNIDYLSKLLPNSKFILMVRDARACAHSIYTRNITIQNLNIHNYRDLFKKWNNVMEHMYSECMIVGSKQCLPVYYEQLVLHPEQEMKKILEFVNIPWDDAVINHEKYIGDEISLSKYERSSDQVIKPINLEALTSWVGKIPEDILNEIDILAPMMKTVGYDVQTIPPNYGDPDKKILENTLKIQANKDYWLQVAKNYSVHV